jgi:hypothetical protein
MAAASIQMEEQSKPSVAATTPAPGKATMFQSAVNLLKNCVGAGVFSLNSKVYSPVNNLPIPAATALIATMASWATYNFHIIGETCKMTNSTSYGDAWANGVNEQSRWIVQAVIVVAPIVSCLAAMIVLTDIAGFVYRAAGLPATVYKNRNLVIATLATIVLYPLCILEDLSALKSVSAVGVLGHMTAMLALGLRIADKSYLPGGKFHADMLAASPFQPAAGQAYATVSTGSAANMGQWFVLASLLSYCFVTHYNAPRYYSELDNQENDPNKFLKMTGIAYLGGTILYYLTMLLGYNLFGLHSQSFALNSFAPKDIYGGISRIAFGTSVLASFPLIFLNMRNWFIEKAKKHAPNLGAVKPMSAVLLALISLMTSRCKDIGIVGALSGGVLGTSMMYIFPPIMYIGALRKKAKASINRITIVQPDGTTQEIVRPDDKSKRQFISAVNMVLLFAGFGIGGFGTMSSIKAALA